MQGTTFGLGAVLALALIAIVGKPLPAAGQGSTGSAGAAKPVIQRAQIRRPVMPSLELEPPANMVPVLQAFAQGVQRYVCSEQANKPGTFAWTLKEPDAKLLDREGKEIGRHFAGPSWELADGSRVVKTKVAGSMHALENDAVPWLLIAVQSSGAGALAGVGYVQRIDTVGGVAPDTGCDASHAKSETDVGYRATYLFYAPISS